MGMARYSCVGSCHAYYCRLTEHVPMYELYTEAIYPIVPLDVPHTCPPAPAPSRLWLPCVGVLLPSP